MDLFYIIVSVVSVIVLIFLLIVVGLMMKSSKSTQQFPSNIEQCPDMWIPDGSFCHFNGVNSGVYEVEGKYLKEGTTRFDEKYTGDKVPFFKSGGTSGSTTIIPSDTKWSSSGVSAICAQNEWAKKYGIQWTGITELNTCK
jgi:hypothetical protein